MRRYGDDLASVFVQCVNHKIGNLDNALSLTCGIAIVLEGF